MALNSAFTAANAATLVTGGDASSLHYHNGTAVPGLTLWTTPAAGEIGYQTSTADTLAKAMADSASTAYNVCGVYAGTAGQVAAFSGDPIAVLFESGLNSGLTGAPAAGQKVYLSDSTAGRATNNIPVTSGHIAVPLGCIKNLNGGYNNSSGSTLYIWPRLGLEVTRA